MSDEKEIGEVDLNEKTLTPEMKKKIDDLILQQSSAELVKEEIKESIKTISAQLGLKPQVFTSRLNMIKKEKGSGGELRSKNQDIAFVEKYFNLDDKNIKE